LPTRLVQAAGAVHAFLAAALLLLRAVWPVMMVVMMMVMLGRSLLDHAKPHACGEESSRHEPKLPPRPTMEAHPNHDDLRC
jgi:hypothetical protein